MTEITQLLQQASNGEKVAANELLAIVYDRLRVIAHRQLARMPQVHTLTTTGLVHEAYLALFGGSDLSWRDRAHFFAYAATAMRTILIDRVRQRQAHKRNGEDASANNPEISLQSDAECIDLLSLDQALARLAVEQPRLAQVVELRFFAGLSVEDTASAMEIDAATVKRDWRKARAFINLTLDRAADIASTSNIEIT